MIDVSSRNFFWTILTIVLTEKKWKIVYMYSKWTYKCQNENSINQSLIHFLKMTYQKGNICFMHAYLITLNSMKNENSIKVYTTLLVNHWTGVSHLPLVCTFMFIHTYILVYTTEFMKIENSSFAIHQVCGWQYQILVKVISWYL